MFMKYLNATLCCYKSVSMTNDKLISLSYPFDSTRTIMRNGTLSADDFYVFTHVNLMGTDDSNEKQDSIIECDGKVRVTIRLTKCDAEASKQLYVDLDSFDVDVNEAKITKRIHKACYKYLNCQRLTVIKSMELPAGCGMYVLKVLVEDLNNPNQNAGIPIVQSMSYLYFEESNGDTGAAK